MAKKIGNLSNLKQIERNKRKNKQSYSEKKLTEQTKRIKEKQKSRRVSATAKTLSRNAALATTAIASAEQQKAKYKADADIAKYTALINGNIYGTNAVDSDKKGSSPSIEEGSVISNSYTGW